MATKVALFPLLCFWICSRKIANHFKKGDRILINGALEQNTWTDRDGNVQSKLVVAISEVDIIEPKPKSKNQANQAKESGVSASEKPNNKYTESLDEVPF